LQIVVFDAVDVENAVDRVRGGDPCDATTVGWKWRKKGYESYANLQRTITFDPSIVGRCYNLQIVVFDAVDVENAVGRVREGVPHDATTVGWKWRKTGSEAGILMVAALWWHGFELKYFMLLLLGWHGMPMTRIHSKMAIWEAMRVVVGCEQWMADLGW